MKMLIKKIKDSANMKKTLLIGFPVFVTAIIASGCVSSSKFEKMEAGKNQEIDVLQQEKAALSDEKSMLEQDNAVLKEQIIALQEQKIEAQQQVETLEQQKTALVETSQQRQQQYEALVKGLSNEVAKGQLKVRQYQNMLAVDLAEQIFFDSGKAKLKKEGKEVLQKVATALKDYKDKVIRVVGHTDNVPVAKSLQGTFPTNWELSVARAVNVVRFLQESGIPPEVLIPSGRGEYNPVASNDTPEGRQKNRRIEIMLIDKSLVTELNKPTN